MTWPPADTERNRLVYTLVVVLGALATVYFLLWALQTRGVVPWAGFTLLLAATLVAGLGRLSMLERGRGATGGGPSDAATGDGRAAPAADPQA